MTAKQVEQAVMEFRLRQRQGPRPLTNIPEPVTHGGQKLEQRMSAKLRWSLTAQGKE